MLMDAGGGAQSHHGLPPHLQAPAAPGARLGGGASPAKGPTPRHPAQHPQAGGAEVREETKMRYPAAITREGKNTLAEFPDCPGCQTFARPGESIEAQAADVLQGWLESELLEGRTPPVPRQRLPRGGIWVEVPPLLAIRISIKRARTAAGLTQAQLAK